MSRLSITLIGIAVAIVVLGLGVVGTIVGTYNDCVAQEAGLKAQYAQNKNNYDNYFKKLKEVAQVPDMYINDLNKVYTSALQGRYGEGGSKAVFQFISEHNPQVDGSIYRQIQQVVEAGRNDFEQNQKQLLDKVRVYEITLQTFPNSVLARVLGFPRVDLSQFKIVTSDETEHTFETGKSEPIKLR